MRSPARLVTGTAAAALTAAALGLTAAPSAHADGFGRSGPAVAATAAPVPAECGPGAVDGDTAAPCDSTGETSEDLEAPGGTGALDDLTAPGSPADEDLSAPAPEDLGAPGDLAADEPETAESLSALPGSLWSETGEEEAATAPAETGAGDEAGATVPGTRPAPLTPPGADPTGPGSAKPPVRPPGNRPTAQPSRPSGHVDTGVGGSAAPDTAQLATGAGLVAAATVGGVLLLRRRRADGTRH
ncbi:hypothetical protein ACFY8O_09130 [Streptomyces argenteolus]|uniref:LPXTG-motif cell wall-anchored protein n=1 Tax=Streptomyces argenteolus TaxID=67274 RepID=A0ABW6X203_9ACTN